MITKTKKTTSQSGTELRSQKEPSTKKTVSENRSSNNKKGTKRSPQRQKRGKTNGKHEIKSEKIIQNKQGTLRITILGGNEETGGKNMSMIEFEDDILLIDMGLKFPEEDMHGIDYVIPNISCLKGREENIRAVVLTHGHLDHIGGVSHIVPLLGNPTIYTGNFTASLIKSRHSEYKNIQPLNVKVCDENSHIKAGKMSFEFVELNHSVPDSMGILVHTPVGDIFHTGDFKFDFSPVNGKPANLGKLADIGNNGLLALMSDSTGAIKPGHQISESIVGEELYKIFATAPRKIFVGITSSNLSRIQQILELAEKLDKHVVLDGRSLITVIDIAFELGYLKVNPKMIIDAKDVKNYPPHKIMIISTGSQGEPNSALPRIIAGEHPHLSMEKDDTVVFSASVIPGNETSVAKLMDGIYKHGCHVFNYRMMDIHAGGHAKAEDQKLLIRLMQPKYFIPIEGSYYFLSMHAKSAEEVGVPKDRIFIADNGQHMEFYKTKNSKVSETEAIGTLTNNKVITDHVMVDGLGVGDVSHIVLRDRQVMADDGMFVVIVTLDSPTGNLIGSPDIISRGFVYMKENKEMIDSARRKVRGIIKKHSKAEPENIDYIKNKIRDDIGLYLYKQTKRRPMVLPVVIAV